MLRNTFFKNCNICQLVFSSIIIIIIIIIMMLIIVIYSFSKRFSNTPYNEILKLYILRKKIHTSKYNVKIAA